MPIFSDISNRELQTLKPYPAILIFDIGKTTKKALVFDYGFHVLEEQTENFKEIKDDDGLPGEDLSMVSDWVKEIFNHYLQHPKFEITHCNISSYGASFVHLDSAGKSIVPFYNYLKTFPASCKEKFLSRYNDGGDISAATASPFLGLLNSGLQLFWLKHEKKEYFQRIETSLHLPQFFTYLLTGQPFTDITSIGCHTMLWDFQKDDYHKWVDLEDIRKLFPPIYHADHTFSAPAIKNIRFGIGVHDSSAALMPYLATQQDPFLLLSTGTWNICFNPFNAEPLSKKELSGDCLSFLTFERKTVKASRIFLGHEHEVQTESLTRYFNVSDDYYKTITFQEEIYRHLESAQVGDSKPFFPMEMEGTGPIPEKQEQQTDYSAFQNFDEAYHQLIRYLVRWQLLSIQLIDPQKKINNLIVVGGFTKSPLFLQILKREDPARKILISDHPRASALGAAWLVAGEQAYRGKAGLLSVIEI